MPGRLPSNCEIQCRPRNCSQRGYLYTGNEIYLAPFDVAKTQANRQLERVDRALGDYPELSAARTRLNAVLSEKFEEMDRTILLKRGRQSDELDRIIRSNCGKALMDEANVYFAGIIRAAEDRLTVAVQEQRANASLLWWVSLLSAAVIVLVAAALTVAVMRYTRELSAARDELYLLNEGLEQRVADRTFDLTRVNEELQRFAYIVTHDLRAPLVNIMGFTKELEGGIESLQTLINKTAHLHDETDLVVRDARVATEVDLPEAIGFIRSSTHKMDTLISAILKLAREGRRQLNIEPIDLLQAVGTSISNVQHQLSAAGGKVTVEIQTNAIMADRLSIEQILGNLLDNAIKYRSEKTKHWRSVFALSKCLIRRFKSTLRITAAGLVATILIACLICSGAPGRRINLARALDWRMSGHWYAISAATLSSPQDSIAARPFRSFCLAHREVENGHGRHCRHHHYDRG